MNATHDGSRICNMCFPDVIVYGEILPGYVLIESRSDDDGRYPEFVQGCLAITSDYHELDYLIPTRPIRNPTKREDPTWDDLPNDHPIWAASDRFDEVVDAIKPRFEGGPHVGYLLFKAGLEAGYDPGKHDFFVDWLVDRMAAMIEG